MIHLVNDDSWQVLVSCVLICWSKFRSTHGS